MKDFTNSKIFDAHMHVGSWGSHMVRGRDIAPFEGREIDSTAKVLAYLARHRIERAVVVPIYSPDQQQAYRINTLVLESARRAPDKIVPGLWVDPSPRLSELLGATLEVAERNNIRVLKMSTPTWAADYSPDPTSWDESFRDSMTAILDYAKQTSSVIQIHTGSEKSKIGLIEKLIRNTGSAVCFHLVHMGNTVGGHFYLVPRLAEWLAEGLNVVCDTSLARGFAVRWLFDLATQNPILRKSIMFASDEPWGIFRAEISKVLDAASEEPELLRDVLWTNASRVYSQWEKLA